MVLDLTDEQAALLLAELDRLIDGDKFLLSQRVTALRAIRAMLKPYPAVQPAASPPQRIYNPPRIGRYKRRG